MSGAQQEAGREFPFATKEAADRQARSQSAAGAPSEVVPHPTAAGRFSVRKVEAAAGGQVSGAEEASTAAPVVAASELTQAPITAAADPASELAQGPDDIGAPTVTDSILDRRMAGAGKMLDGDIGRDKDGAPFSTERAVVDTLNKRGLAGTHDVVELSPDQFVIWPRAEEELDDGLPQRALLV